MSLTKTARFPGRVEARRKSALARRERNIKLYRNNETKHARKPEKALEHAEADVAALKVKLRIK